MKSDYDPDDEDLRHDAAVQREIDERTDMAVRLAAAQRAAAGVSAEQLSLQDAFIEGQRAGHLGLTAALNPYQAGCLEHDEWERARSCVVGAFLNGSLRRIA